MEASKIREALRFDGIHEAEKISGISYKKDINTGFLGMSLSIENNEKKSDILRSLGDTTMSSDVPETIKAIEAIGFKMVLDEPFTNTDGIEEHLFLFWNYENSVLICFDSYTIQRGDSREMIVNGGHMYYNWQPNNIMTRTDFTSSGHFTSDYIWIGSHDVREAIKLKFNGMLENGTYIKNWVERPFLWLLNYMDKKNEGYDYKIINEERIAKLPEQVRMCIGEIKRV